MHGLESSSWEYLYGLLLSPCRCTSTLFAPVHILVLYRPIQIVDPSLFWKEQEGLCQLFSLTLLEPLFLPFHWCLLSTQFPRPHLFIQHVHCLICQPAVYIWLSSSVYTWDYLYVKTYICKESVNPYTCTISHSSRRTQQLKTPVSVVPRGRPRVRPAHRAPSPNFTPSYLPSHLHPPPAVAAMASSLDSGLNKFGPSDREAPVGPPASRDLEQQQQIIQRQQQRARSSELKCKSVYVEHDGDKEENLDQFGQPYFTPQKLPAVVHHLANRDEFGHTPFVARDDCSSPLSSNSSSQGRCVIDEFGTPHFASRSTSKQSNTSGNTRATKDIFGAQPFVPSTDAFGATPFVTS